MVRFFAGLLLLCAVGCSSLDKLPAGSQLQSSTFGVRIAPQSADGTPFTLGSHSVIITTAQPETAGPNLNRFEGQAPGVNIRSTVASGPVGEQLKAAGGAPAIEKLMQGRTSPPPISAAAAAVPVKP